MVLSLLACVQLGCELDPDRAGDGPLYYACDPAAPSCAGGFDCWPGVARVDNGEGVQESGLCLSAASLGDADVTTDTCGTLLEKRASGFDASGEVQCMLPFQCPEGVAGEVLPGDATACPLGFVCIAGDDGDPCAACGFASCDMSVYGAPSARLTGLTNEFDACAVRNTGDASPFAGEVAGRIFCQLDPAQTAFPGCPAGWMATDTLPEGCPQSGTTAENATFCYLVATVGDPTNEDPGLGWPQDAVYTGSDTRTSPVAPLMLAPAGSTQSCRPSP